MIRANIVFVPIVLLTLALSIVEAKREIPGAIELIGYNSRKARMNADSFDESKHVTLPMEKEKEKADIETLKHNIDAYNKLMKVDTKKLNNQQKDMLERIVERVARLKAVLDVDKSNNHTKDSTDNKTTTVDMDKTTTPMAAEASSIATTAAVEELTTTTTTATTTSTTTTTTAKPPLSESTTVKVADKNEARANNNLNSNLGNSRVDGLPKVRQTTTPKYSTSSGKTTNKRNNLHRVSQKHTSATPASGSNTKSASSSTSPVHHSGSTMVTATPMQQQLKQHHAKPHNTQSSVVAAVQETSTIKLQLPQSSDNAEESTNGANGGGSLASDLIYDANETASSIIDTLANHAREDYYTKGPLIESTNGHGNNNNKGKKPSATAKPTKYHYYPHNQHIYLLPECAIQQVCNAVYVRLNYTQPLCACPSRYRDPCSASLNEDDQHTTKLIGNSKKKAITLAKTCEATTEMRECRSPKDWSLLALQNTRTGKSHYLVICRCPDHFKLEGPMAHDQPTYASVPGIRVFGMMCVRPGFAVRKPSVQPPKRYQLQKPFYMPTSNQQYSSTNNKDSRPTYQDDSYQMQHQANYQYLNRPESSSIINISNAQDFVDSISLNNFDGSYGRNNVRKGETGVAADSTASSSSSDTKTKREKRSTINNDDPPFPWERLAAFQNSVIWD